METAEHDAFGGEADVDWKPPLPSRNPGWYWAAVGVIAVSMGTGAFVGMRSAASHSTATNQTNRTNQTNQPANGFFGGPPGQGGPGFGPPPQGGRTR